VGQEPVLFQGSVAENILRGHAGAEDDPLLGLEEALRVDETSEGSFCCATMMGEGFGDSVRSFHTARTTDIEANRASPDKLIDESVIDAAKASNAHEFITSFTTVR
jgi:ABC-type multidrug transport system fused ATPase/permease subunit